MNMGNDLLLRQKKYLPNARRSLWCVTKAIILTMILDPLCN